MKGSKLIRILTKPIVIAKICHSYIFLKYKKTFIFFFFSSKYDIEKKKKKFCILDVYFCVGVLGRLVVCLVERQWPAHISLIAGQRGRSRSRSRRKAVSVSTQARSGSGMRPRPRPCSALITGQSITHHHHRGRTEQWPPLHASIPSKTGGPGTRMDHAANVMYTCITSNSKFSALVGFIKRHATNTCNECEKYQRFEKKNIIGLG